VGGVRKRKALKRLELRRAAWEKHGKNPQANPSNAHGTGHDMHRPGSMNGRK
jgi:hypothetical protein